MPPNAAGTHLSHFERALGRYLLSMPSSSLTSLADLAFAEVEHEPGYGSDSGTWWPEETWVVFQLFDTQLRKDGTRGVGKRQHRVYSGKTSPVEFMRTLLDDFSDGGAGEKGSEKKR